MITLAKVAVAQGDLDRARRVIGEATKAVGDGGYEDIYQGLFSVQGRIELQSGNLKAAHDLLLRALEITQRSNLGAHIGSRQIDLGEVAIAQDQPAEASSYFEGGLENSRQCLRQDNIARAEFGMARIHALRGNNSKAVKLALSAREQFLRMGMEHEACQTDTLLHQLGAHEEQHE